ncbi:MAG: hypothetical protein M1839_008325 [Geoglossum umbratile]|nr:MAG: hypothetical protein M1839_008325 [Geoglossum umbratile]
MTTFPRISFFQSLNTRTLKIVIFTDNQAVLTAITDPDELYEDGRIVEPHSVPPHRGIEGNEKADVAAKEARGWKTVRQENGKWKETDINGTASKPEKLRHLRAAASQTVQRAIEKEWEKQWKGDDRGRDLYRITPNPTRAVL